MRKVVLSWFAFLSYSAFRALYFVPPSAGLILADGQNLLVISYAGYISLLGGS